MLLVGCATPGGAGSHAGESYIVSSPSTFFYIYAPATDARPDYSLDHGTRLIMLSYEYGFSHVAVAATAQSGYVATSDVAPSPPPSRSSASPSPRPSPSPTPALVVRTHHRPSSEASATAAPVDESQAPMPTFYDSLPPAGAPSYRY
jgi:hypothetical protein